MGAIQRGEGVTTAERYLKRLCDRSFLALWSYPNVFRDQGRVKGRGDGRELCDLLVVFGEHVIIFSDKHCAFPRSGNLELDWARWYRRAVVGAAKQIWGAESTLKTHPETLYLDPACREPFPLALPGPAIAKYHRIVVAHDVSAKCREVLGGSGSLMLTSVVIGQMPGTSMVDSGGPFTIGQVDPTKGFIHVFDDTVLDTVMDTLDTIADFTTYLTKKERFFQGGLRVMAAGEDELLAYYLRGIDAGGEHDFITPPDAGKIDYLGIDEGFWEEFVRSPERQAQIEADGIS